MLWHKPGLVWAIDATQYASHKIIPLHDLASRYRFAPLVSSVEDGQQIALYLDQSFREHGAPLFLKRDNGSPFNNQHVDAVLAEHLVLPLNNPPRFPRYHGAMEKGIGDLKRDSPSACFFQRKASPSLLSSKRQSTNSTTGRAAASMGKPPVKSTTILRCICVAITKPACGFCDCSTESF